MMNDGVYLRVQLAVCLGHDLGSATSKNAVMTKAFPGVNQHYGCFEIYDFLTELSDAVVRYIEQRFGCLADFWDYLIEDTAIGVFVYEVSADLLARLTELPIDPVTSGDPKVTAEQVAAEVMTRLLDGPTPSVELSNRITNILFT
jgi:hypothetical protein